MMRAGFAELGAGDSRFLLFWMVCVWMVERHQPALVIVAVELGLRRLPCQTSASRSVRLTAS